jgi:dipeptidyl aminopeptidase/acylaminoacyl peptidase
VSPSGNRLAVLIYGTNGMRRLGVIDLNPIGAPRIIGAFDDADVNWAAWVNDERLVFAAHQRGTEIREGGAATYAVNHDGSDSRQLILWRYATETLGSSRIVSRVLPYGWAVSWVPADGDDVIVSKTEKDGVGDVTAVIYARLNTSTRELKNLSFGTPQYTSWVGFDTSRNPRIALADRSGRRKVYWRMQDDSWKEVMEVDGLRDRFSALHIGSGGKAVVLVRTGDTTALHEFDGPSGKLDQQPMLQLKNFDLSASAEIDSRTRRLLGVHFTADRPMSYWFDERMESIQKRVDAGLPQGRSNRLYCGQCQTSRFYVVRSASDRQPGEYYLYDHEKASLQRIGASRPWIDEATQGRRSFHRVQVRDGLTVPVVVTHPAGAAADKPLPTVVIVHGGPFVRGSNLAWHAEAQLLASRGYRVLQPEFRGSRGFGQRYYEAGWKQWGDGMINDVADVVQWAGREGLTDPSRVCISGGSYGGYAALMSTIAHPTVYRCAVSFAGVVDPKMMYDVSWSDLQEDDRRHYLPVVMGDPEKDAALLAAHSPLKRVAEIKVPVLLVHGGLDRRVPIVHARDFASAAERAGVKLERVDYLDEGHGFNLFSNKTDYYKRLVNFLGASLAPPGGAPQGAKAP